jgi:flagellar protein FlaJ
MKLSFEMKMLLACVAASAFLIILGIASSDLGVIGNTIILSTFLMLVPQLLFRYQKYKAIKEMEEKFPIFLRDLTESIRSGMPFHQTILVANKLDYGRLSNEIRKMANQISWGMPFDKVIDQFSERVKGSKRLNLALKTIKETYISGGDVASTLESVADNSTILEDSEKERKSLLNQYVVLMYAICFMFVGIVAAINRIMVPIFQTSTVMGINQELISNPCSSSYGFSFMICKLFDSVAIVFKIPLGSIAAYYTSLFFFMSIIEAMCCGLVAGQISENSITAGIKHSVIMTTVTFGAFSILVRLKLLGV